MYASRLEKWPEWPFFKVPFSTATLGAMPAASHAAVVPGAGGCVETNTPSSSIGLDASTRTRPAIRAG